MSDSNNNTEPGYDPLKGWAGVSTIEVAEALIKPPFLCRHGVHVWKMDPRPSAVGSDHTLYCTRKGCGATKA